MRGVSPVNSVRNLYRLIECCLNWRVIAGLALAAAALFVLAPTLAVASLPVLLALVCPISMLVMVVSMGRRNMGDGGAGSRQEQLEVFEERVLRLQEQRREMARQLIAAGDGKGRLS